MEAALPPIPAKRYFTIGEVSELCGVNRRYYQHHEVLLVRRIRELLYDHGFTISGARNKLGDHGTSQGNEMPSVAPSVGAWEAPADDEANPAALTSEGLRAQLLAIRAMLDG
jgi:DNA-binding transcriptional MerR regulator